MTVGALAWSLPSVTPALGRWSQEDVGSSLGSQAAKPVSSEVRRDTASNTKVGNDDGRSQMSTCSLHEHADICAHLHTRAYAEMGGLS